MSNETLEFIRIMTYLVGVTLLFYLGVIVSKVRVALYTLAVYFALWGSLLIVQIRNPGQYREISNEVATPALLVMVGLIFYNLWLVRKD